MRFEVKKDLWVVLLMYLPIAISIFVVGLSKGIEILYVILIMLPLDLVILWILYGSFYELRENELYIRIGPFRQHIPYDKIHSIEKTKTVLSSMAMSVDRVEIARNDKGRLLGVTQISPQDKERFILEISKRCPNIKR